MNQGKFKNFGYYWATDFQAAMMWYYTCRATCLKVPFFFFCRGSSQSVLWYELNRERAGYNGQAFSLNTNYNKIKIHIPAIFVHVWTFCEKPNTASVCGLYSKNSETNISKTIYIYIFSVAKSRDCVVLYGCEIWACEKMDVISKL